MYKNQDYILSNGVKIPKIGFGTWQIADDNAAYTSTTYALKAGYRHIDTAYAYGNEKAIGRAIKDSGIDRESLFIVTKLPAEIKTAEGCRKHFKESLEALGLDYIDLYLIHAPWPWSEQGKDCREGNIEVWKVMIELYNAHLIRSIGVSNFSPDDIENIVKATNFVPHVNQIRYFIGNTEPHVVEYCEKHNILVEAYSPFATGNILQDENIQKLADKYQTTISKICLAFCLQNNTLPLPKSSHEERIIDNLDVTITLSNEDMDYLREIDQPHLHRPYRS